MRGGGGQEKVQKTLFFGKSSGKVCKLFLKKVVELILTFYFEWNQFLAFLFFFWGCEHVLRCVLIVCQQLRLNSKDAKYAFAEELSQFIVIFQTLQDEYKIPNIKEIAVN